MESLFKKIPDPIGKIVCTNPKVKYDLALVFKKMLVIESQKVNNATYFVPLKEEIQEGTPEEVFSQVEPYLQKKRRELRNQFGAESQKHPDQNLPTESFKADMLRLIDTKLEMIQKTIDELAAVERERKD